MKPKRSKDGRPYPAEFNQWTNVQRLEWLYGGYGSDWQPSPEREASSYAEKYGNDLGVEPL